MSKYKQPLIIIACGILLWAITAQLNHYLAVWHINLFTCGLVLSYPALRLHNRDIWRIVLPLGLWQDAATAVPFGMHALLFLLCCAIIQQMRARLPRADTILGIIVAVIANAATFAAISIAFALRGPIPDGIISTLVVNIVLSTLFIVVIAPWFFALQTHALVIAGVDLHTQSAQKIG